MHVKRKGHFCNPKIQYSCQPTCESCPIPSQQFPSRWYSALIGCLGVGVGVWPKTNDMLILKIKASTCVKQSFLNTHQISQHLKPIWNSWLANKSPQKEWKRCHILLTPVCSHVFLPSISIMLFSLTSFISCFSSLSPVTCFKPIFSHTSAARGTHEQSCWRRLLFHWSIALGGRADDRYQCVLHLQPLVPHFCFRGKVRKVNSSHF